MFRRTGRKVTPQRQCIFGVLYGNTVHPTAETVHEQARRRMAAISLKTVYQTLHELVAMGEVRALDLGTGTIRFDPNVDGTHHHLVCRACGKVRDLHADFSAVQVPIGDDGGFEVGPAEVVFRGLCAGCRGDASMPWGVERGPEAASGGGPRAGHRALPGQPNPFLAERSAPCSTYDIEEDPSPWLN